MTDTLLATILARVWHMQFHSSWRDQLKNVWGHPKFRELVVFLETEYKQHQILPETDLIFNAFNLTPFDAVKVVIIGQDPYPNPEFAHGLAFSVRPRVRIPMSLLNIFRELQTDLAPDRPLPQNGSLIDWSRQGVLLLNTSLTVRAGEPASHAKRGWEILTDEVVNMLSRRKQNLVFILWGSHAISKELLIDPTRHLILRSSHPSFRSFNKTCGVYPPFQGSRPFSTTNAYLTEHGHAPIDWTTLT